jgi:AmiR/NasT family two-component response regulator
MGPDGLPQHLVTEGNLDDLRGLSRRIGEAMSARAIVEQAKGVIMGARRCGPDEAFDALRRSAHLEKMRVQDVARRVLEAVAAPDGV